MERAGLLTLKFKSSLVEHSQRSNMYARSYFFQYAFCCNEEEEVTQMDTLIRVDDGTVHIVNIRYGFNLIL